MSDLTRMGEWSPENCGGRWTGGHEGAVGTTFRGHNRGPHGEWETDLTITESEPGRRFGFRVAPPGVVGTTWSYSFEPAGKGTVVTETFDWYWTPTPKEGFRGRMGALPLDEATAQVADRERHLQGTVDVTLERLKVVLEAAHLLG